MTISRNTIRHKFPKLQKLCSRKSIERLFEGGDGSKAVSAFPIRAVFSANDGAQTQVLISVSKRRLHHATDRNRAKRQLREAWRLSNDILADMPTMNIAFIWLADAPQPSSLIFRKMKNVLHRIAETHIKPQTSSHQS